ncbi:MAG: aldo/keto reductase [Acidimicrobiales bacterium]
MPEDPNFSSAQLREAHETASSHGLRHFVSVQDEYSLLHREPEAEVLPECEALGIAFLPFYPLFAGVLSGKYRAGEDPPPGTRLAGYPAERRRRMLSERNIAVVDRLDAFARERGHSVLELAIAWLLARRVVASVIAGATRPEQVRANARAASWELSAADLVEVDRAVPGPSGSGGEARS